MSDKKITQLSALLALDDTDLLVVVDDVAGTPTTKKITVANAKAGLSSAPATDSDQNVLAVQVFSN